MTDITIVRGLIGSGKTTLANHLAKKSHQFTLNDFYTAEPPGAEPVMSAHAAIRARHGIYESIRRAAENKVPAIVIDGCFTTRDCVKRLLYSLRGLGHLNFSVVMPTTRWANDPFTCVGKTQHGVALPVIIRQQQKFENITTDDVRDLWTNQWLEEAIAAA